MQSRGCQLRNRGSAEALKHHRHNMQSIEEKASHKKGIHRPEPKYIVRDQLPTKDGLAFILSLIEV